MKVSSLSFTYRWAILGRSTRLIRSQSEVPMNQKKPFWITMRRQTVPESLRAPTKRGNESSPTIAWSPFQSRWAGMCSGDKQTLNPDGLYPWLVSEPARTF